MQNDFFRAAEFSELSKPIDQISITVISGRQLKRKL